MPLHFIFHKLRDNFLLLETGRNKPGVSDAIRRRSGGGADGQAPSEDTPSSNKTRWLAFSVFSYVVCRDSIA